MTVLPRLFALLLLAACASPDALTGAPPLLTTDEIAAATARASATPPGDPAVRGAALRARAAALRRQ